MAGKKKKKPAGNPARGFATTSLPSKAKEIPTSDDDEVSAVQAKDVGLAFKPKISSSSSENATTSPITVDETTSLIEMTPEELEQYLEQAELSRLIEQSGQRVKSDAKRQITKLRNERRQLRAQADSAVMVRLTEELITDILHHGDITFNSTTLTEIIKSSLQDTQDVEPLIKLWTLQEVLSQLGFPSVDDALAHVVLAWRQIGLSTGDYIPGLCEAFVWYARHKSPHELPDYETGTVQLGSDEPGQDIVSANSKPDFKTSVIEMNEHQGEDNQTISKSDQVAAEPLSESELSTLEEGYNTEDDNPDQLVDRWIRLQSLKFTIEHAERRSNTDNRLKRLFDRLRYIERDVLFDEALAQQLWQPLFREMQIEHGRRSRHAEKANSSTQTPVDLEVPDVDAFGSEPLLSAIFESEEESSQLSAPVDGDKVIILRDFGSWSGIHPRRLLEEFTSGTETRGRIYFRVLSSTNYSTRLQLDLKWDSKIIPDALYVKCLPAGITCEHHNLSWALKMDSVATASVSQGEAFLAILSVFLLSSSDAVNTNVLQRLPKIWKDLLMDLRETQAQLEKQKDVETLLHIREIMSRSEQDPLMARNSKNKVGIQHAQKSRSARNNFIRSSPEAARQSWLQRAASMTFNDMRSVRESLPIFQYKQEILDAFHNNQVLIICADTGAGKSTQIPSYILEDQLCAGRDYNIMVTQPRRISAMSIARRISAEIGEDKSVLGTSRSLIGYTIRMESKTSEATRITFATTGVLIRMLQETENLDHLDTLILDEVHERTMEIDLILIALKRLRLRRSNIKIVLMSATVDASKFSKYFDNAPILSIPGRTFPVEVHFLEDAIEETSELESADSQVQEEHENQYETTVTDFSGSDVDEIVDSEKYSTTTQRVLSTYDQTRVNFDLVVKLCCVIATSAKYKAYSDAILIFMPGIAEIKRLHTLLLSNRLFSKRWKIHMLHSSFSMQELEQAFLLPPPGHRKIVIGTNIAETGVTISDITTVIDTCKEKVMRFDERRQLSRLTEGFISRASAKQRRGRAARVREGLCFHLVTRTRFEKMPEQATPEILRLSLQDPILRVKVWKLGPIEEVLSAAIDPPTAKNIRRAASKLQDVGAIDTSENLTPLGRVLSRLPLDVSLGKMAVFGVVFQCLDAILTIIASFSVKSVFVEQTAGSQSGYAAFARGDSDFLTVYNAYQSWKKAVKAGTGQQFCYKYHLSAIQLQQLEEQKIQTLVYVVDAGLVTLNFEEANTLRLARYSRSHQLDFEVPSRFDRLSSDAMINAAVAMALYPKLLKRDGQGYRNVYSNQHLQLAPHSTNKIAPKPPSWLSYLEATQTKNGKLNALHSSRVTYETLTLLLGEANFRYFAGVVDIDHGRIRLSFRKWKDMVALQVLRFQLRRAIDEYLTEPKATLGATFQQWLDLMTIAFDGSPQSRAHLTSGQDEHRPGYHH